MPKLPDYDSTQAQRGLQPNDMGIYAHEQEGRAWGAAFNQMGAAAQRVGNAVEQHEAQTDAANLTRQSAQTSAGLTQSWNDAASKADPNDPDFAEKWRTDVLEPALEKFGADVGSKHGEEAAERMRTQMRSHFTEKSIADQTYMSGLSALTSLNESANILSNAARNDPTALPALTGIFDTAIENEIATHKMDPGTAARIKTELREKVVGGMASSAFQGLAETDATKALESLKAGAWDKYFNATQRTALEKYATEQGKLNDSIEIKQNKQDAEAELNSLYSSTIDEKTGQLVIPRDFFANIGAWSRKWAGKPGAGETVAEKQRSAINFARSVINEIEQGQPSVDDVHTYEDFSNRLTLPGTDPRRLTAEEVIQARADRKLSDKSYSFFNGALGTLNRDPAYRYADARFKDFMRSIKSSITNSNILMGSNDPAGDQKWGQFQAMARDAFEESYKSGQWHDLLDRNRPNSLWHRAVPYMTDQKGAMANMQNRIEGSVGLVPSVNAPKRLPNESPAAYLARTKGAK